MIVEDFEVVPPGTMKRLLAMDAAHNAIMEIIKRAMRKCDCGAMDCERENIYRALISIGRDSVGE
ncbi:MAG: hypothetical protein OHK0044_01880 [Burkholderiaceae bacterium]